MDINLQQLNRERASNNNSILGNDRSSMKFPDSDQQNRSLHVENQKKKFDVTQNNLETDNLHEDQQSPKKIGEPSALAPFNQELPQLTAVKESSNKKKILIALSIFVVIGVIVGGIVLATQLNKDSSEDGNKNYNPVIKIPASYSKYEKQITQGQETNLVKIIQVPKSQKFYDYNMVTEQTTVGGDGKSKVSTSVISHRFGLYCSDVQENYFEMYLYFQNTTLYDNDTITNQYQGYPEVLNVKEPGSRFLNKKEEKTSEQNNEFLVSSSLQSIANEYNPLTENEINILKSKGISVSQYFASSVPVIKFTVSKDGSILSIQLPINLRYDLLQIYLNVLEQVSPIVQADNYKISKKDTNGKTRILNAQKQYFQRILEEDVPAEMEASVNSNGEGNFKKSYNHDKKNNESGKESLSYTQDSTIQNGSLLESKVNSAFSMSDNKPNQTSGDDFSIIKGLDVKSSCSIKFVSMQEEVSEADINKLVSTQSKISTWNYTYQSAKDAHAAMFKKTKAEGIPQDDGEIEQAKKGIRRLAEDKIIGETIQKPIYRKNFASMEFGADLKSECVESGIIDEDDICTVGLYSFFNGETQKLVEKKTRLNISKILKYYQYIQHILTFKMDDAKNTISTKLNNVNDSLNQVLDQLEILIDVQQNPLIKDIYNAINNDEFKIISFVQNFENMINTSLKNMSELVKDPLNALKQRTLSFLSEKQINIESQVNSIQNFYIDKLLKLKDFVIKAKQTGMDEKVAKKIKNILDNIDGVIIQLIDKPAKKLLDQVEAMINEQASKIFAHSSELDKKITSLTDSVTQQVPAQMKKVLGNSFLVDYLESYVQKSIKEVIAKVNVTELLSNQLKNAVNGIKNEILNQMDTIAKKSTVNTDEELKNLLEEANQVFSYSTDLYSGILELKEDVTSIVEQLKKLQSENTYQILVQLTQNLSGFPVDLAKQLIDQGKQTATKVVEIGKNIKNQVIKYQQDITAKSLQLLNEIKDIYKEAKAFLTKKDFPAETPEYYKTPLFNEISFLVKNATEIFNLDYSKIVTTYERFKLVPAKFQKFIDDFKVLGSKSMDYFNQIKLSFSNIKADGKLFWNELVAKYVSIKGKRRMLAAPQIVDDIRAKIAENIKSYSANITDVFGTNFQNEIMTKVQDVVGKSVKNIVEEKLNQVKDGNINGLLDVQNLYQSLITELVKNFEFQKNQVFPPLSFPVEYTYLYPTPIGVAIKLKIYAKWDTNIRFNALFKNAIFDLGASVSTKVNVAGEVAASVVVAEVGGYCEGTFLDTTLTAGINVAVLKNFEGSLYVDAQFSPYDVRIGLYYSTIFSKQTLQCAKDVATGKRNLGALDKVTDFVKSNVGAIASSSDNPIVKKVTDAASCVQGMVSTPNRNNIFEPLAIKGETYKKRLIEVPIRRPSTAIDEPKKGL